MTRALFCMHGYADLLMGLVLLDSLWIGVVIFSQELMFYDRKSPLPEEPDRIFSNFRDVRSADRRNLQSSETLRR